MTTFYHHWRTMKWSQSHNQPGNIRLKTEIGLAGTARFTKDEGNRIITTDQDAALPLMFLRRTKGRKLLSEARSRLIELGCLKPLRQAGPGHPALFRWVK